MAFKGRDPVRPKIVIDKIIEQVKLFNYLGNISYEKGLDIDYKLHNYLKITGILNTVFARVICALFFFYFGRRKTGVRKMSFFFVEVF
jgi:hypothetical protein